MEFRLEDVYMSATLRQLLPVSWKRTRWNAGGLHQITLKEFLGFGQGLHENGSLRSLHHSSNACGSSASVFSATQPIIEITNDVRMPRHGNTISEVPRSLLE